MVQGSTSSWSRFRSIMEQDGGGAAVQANLADGVPKLHTFNVHHLQIPSFHELNLVRNFGRLLNSCPLSNSAKLSAKSLCIISTATEVISTEELDGLVIRQRKEKLKQMDDIWTWDD
jgi:hypothetical protein